MGHLNVSVRGFVTICKRGDDWWSYVQTQFPAGNPPSTI